MLDERTQMLFTTLHKLYRRGAKSNIQKILVKTHEADIAAILEQFDDEDRIHIFKSEPSLEKRAAILSHLDEEFQTQLLEQLSQEELIKLLTRMESDDVADLLGHLPEEQSQVILNEMEIEDSEEVADLLGYPEDSAGGLMSYDYFAMDGNSTVEQTIQAIQEEDSNTIMFYIYVVNENEQLIGVLSLKQLLLSKKQERLRDIMFPEVISVRVDTDSEDVAKVVERYDFLSIPVVDSNNKLEGVITVDDIIDVIREEAQEDLLTLGQAGNEFDAPFLQQFKARAPWMLFSFIGGVLSFLVVYYLAPMSFKDVPNSFLILAAFLPLLLTIGATTGSQAVSVAISSVRANKWDFSKTLGLEFRMGILFGFIIFCLSFLLSETLLSELQFNWKMSSVIGLQVLFANLLGGLLPFSVQKLGVDPLVGTVPLFTAVVDLLAVSVLFGLFMF